MVTPSRNIIQIVDDMVSNRIFLRNILQDDYELLEAGNGVQALEQLQRYHDQIAAVLLDVMMPVMDGIQTLKEMRKLGYLDEFPVLIVTSDTDSKGEAMVLELGASDVVRKPYDPAVIKRRISNLVGLFFGKSKLENRADNLEKVLNTSSIAVVSMLATVTEFRSLESGQHTLRIKRFTNILLRAVAERFPEYDLHERDIELISNAAILHDVGKVMVPDSILNKPGKLTPDEFELMKSHTTAGCEILNKMMGVLDDEFMGYAYNICRYHHERWDGQGYPDGLMQNNIPLCAQVVSICDVYDALTTPRVYKTSFSHEKAVDMILHGECGAFNPQMLECFCQVLEEFKTSAKMYVDSEERPSANDIYFPQPISAATTLKSEKEQLATAKYQALCRMVNGMVLEVDMDTGTYTLAYNSGKESFRAGRSIRELMLDILNTAVHPEDKRIAMDHLVNFQKEFFDEGLRVQSRRYRVRETPTSPYVWVESSHLRIYTGRPQDKKALCIWRVVNPVADAMKMAAENRRELRNYQCFEHMPGIALCCRQDRWMTIEAGLNRLVPVLGYSLRELQEKFHSRLLEMVMPEDQDMVGNHLEKIWNRGVTAELEYRLCRKDGSAVWVAEKSSVEKMPNGREYVYRILLDNTRTQKELCDARLKLERQQLLLNNANEIFFEWDLTTDEIYFTENFKDTFGYAISGKNFSNRLKNSTELVYEEDVSLLLELIEKVKDGKNFAEQEIRMKKADDTYLWCRVRAVGQQWENGKTVSLLGSITNIDVDKMVMQNLKYQTERDGLTGLLNRTAATQKIEQYLQEERPHKAAILILDIDNFKRVNDTYGHMAGDSVLIACGEVIRRQFRNEDIVARIGGDEFMICLQNVTDAFTAGRCCQKIVNRFARDVASMAADCNISCSVGVAMYPKDGRNFQELFKNADEALLYAKENGKNRYAMFEELGEERTIYRSNRTEIESNERPNLTNQGLIEYTLHHLYQSGNLEETIQNVLEMVGRQIRVSRVYIFENSKDDRYCCNTFEWCNDGIESVKERQQRVSYDTTLKNWASVYDHSNIFYCRDVRKLPQSVRELAEANGTKSFLHCAIKDGGKIRGYVGFNDCVVNRLWNMEQLTVLESFAEVLSLFLLKKRAQDDMRNWADSLMQLLNHSKEWIYVIERDSYQILFLNEQLQQLAPKLKLGDKCYKAIVNQDKPCERCPVKKFLEGDTEPVELENAYLGKHVSAQAEEIFWNGENVMLLTCREIKRPASQAE